MEKGRSAARVQRVQRVQRVVVAASPQIIKADYKKGARLRRRLCRRVVHRFAQGATALAALRVVDCRSAAMLIKSALRIHLSVSYGMIGILMISHLRWLFPPLVPYGTTFPPRWEACHTILRSLCSLTNRVPLPPLSGGTIKSRKAIPS